MTQEAQTPSDTPLCARCGGPVLSGDEDLGMSYRKDDGTQQEYGPLKPLRHKSPTACLVYVLRKSTIVAVPDRFLT
jgi:hypothetical protein